MTVVLWPTYDSPDDLDIIETRSASDRGLPATTYEIIVPAAAHSTVSEPVDIDDLIASPAPARR